MSDILLIFAAIGAMLIIKDGFIFESLRTMIKNKATFINKTLGVYVDKLLSCAQCLGFWCGFFIYFIYSFSEQSYNNILLVSLYFGFIVSFLGYVCDMILTLIDEKIFKLQKENEGKID